MDEQKKGKEKHLAIFEGSEVYEKIVQLKMIAEDGKTRDAHTIVLITKI